MQKSGFCVSTGKCVANAYRKVVESTNRLGDFFGKAVRAVVEQFRGHGFRSEEEGPPAGPSVPEKSSEQMDAVFSHAMRQFQSPDPAVRAAALRVFERLGKAESIARATVLLDDPDADVRARAQEILRELGPAA